MNNNIDYRFGGRWWILTLTAFLFGSGPAAAQHFAVDKNIDRLVEPAPSLASDGDGAVLEGLRIFTRETFGGNGRVCASCHPVTNNFTIDPAFIKTLPRRDPLFVAEYDPNLRDLEQPVLMRRFGLIVENLDGFDQPGVMRSVPHTLGLRQSIAKDQGSPTREAFELVHMTGWSGDGAPKDGSLRNFAVGAVVQHFPRTLDRKPCSRSAFNTSECDFRLPTKAELAALVSFQLFLGRQTEMNLEGIDFNDAFVKAGKALFFDAPAANKTRRSCSFCHTNAGANDPFGNGRLFATGANKHPNAPACRLPGVVPGDGGYDVTPETTESGLALCGSHRDFAVIFRGTDEFNTPSLIEAADTPPYFHNNIVNTIEQAVNFYNSDVFGKSPAGGGQPFALHTTQVNQIAALLRALNALDNISNGTRFDQLAQRQAGVRRDLAVAAVEIAASDTEDAIRVLTSGPVSLYGTTNVIALLRQALQAERLAIRQRNPDLVGIAVALKDQARDQMIEVR